jgi:hypothetical protein
MVNSWFQECSGIGMEIRSEYRPGNAGKQCDEDYGHE